MNKKRYAIVRVDNHCPEGLYENIKPNTLCSGVEIINKEDKYLTKKEGLWYFITFLILFPIINTVVNVLVNILLGVE